MKNIEHTLNRVMILKGGADAIHQLGNLKREDDAFIRVYAENDKEFIGCFEEGFGFIDVKFKKSDCRKLTKDEIEDLNKKFYAVGKTVYGRINLDSEGNYV